jgi:endothelin-converting enzyme/putative endopeptidase
VGVQLTKDYIVLKNNPRPELIDGFTPEQRFFISWTTVWRTKSVDEAIKKSSKETDPRSGMYWKTYVKLDCFDAATVKKAECTSDLLKLKI